MSNIGICPNCVELCANLIKELDNNWKKKIEKIKEKIRNEWDYGNGWDLLLEIDKIVEEKE